MINAEYEYTSIFRNVGNYQSKRRNIFILLRISSWIVSKQHRARPAHQCGAVGTCPSIWQHRQFWLVNITILVLYRGFVKESKLRLDAVS
jgi:hypothetical protein